MNSSRPRASFDVLASGAGACFRRPEFADDLVSYDVITPVAALRLLDTAFPLNSGRWELKRIRVLSEIAWRWSSVAGARGTKRTMLLCDVCYLITAEVVGGEAPDRSVLAASLQSCTSAFFGLVEYPAQLRLLDERPPKSPLAGAPPIDLGWTVYDHQGKGRARTRFFRLRLIDGDIDLSPAAVGPLAS